MLDMLAKVLIGLGRQEKMPKCSYCGKMYEPPRGLTLVLKDGSARYFCSAKCRKNRDMKRRKVRWIKKGKKVSQEEIKAELGKEE